MPPLARRQGDPFLRFWQSAHRQCRHQERSARAKGQLCGVVVYPNHQLEARRRRTRVVIRGASSEVAQAQEQTSLQQQRSPPPQKSPFVRKVSLTLEKESSPRGGCPEWQFSPESPVPQVSVPEQSQRTTHRGSICRVKTSYNVRGFV